MAMVAIRIEIGNRYQNSKVSSMVAIVLLKALV